MSNTTNDCSQIEQRIDEYNLYISTTQDQLDKVDPDDPDGQNKRDAITRKLSNLQEQVSMLQNALEDCRQGKGANLPPLVIVPEGDTLEG